MMTTPDDATGRDETPPQGDQPPRPRRPPVRSRGVSQIGRPRSTRRRPEGSPPVKPGRKPGQVTRCTADVRAAFTALVEHNAPKMQRWIDRVSRDDPGRAFEMIAKLSEFVVPRLARMEVRPVAPALPEGEVDSSDAAAVYARIVAEPGADLSRLRFARPAIEHAPPPDASGRSP